MAWFQRDFNREEPRDDIRLPKGRYRARIGGRAAATRRSRGADLVIPIREQITIASPPEAVWPLLSDPALVASCIPGATLTKAGDDGAYQGTMRVKFGPTVAQFRGEAKLAYDHAARRCTIEGRGIDGRGASRANASGVVEASGAETTLLKVEGTFNVVGPLETFANAGGVHLARAILAEFAENVAKLVRDAPAGIATLAPPLGGKEDSSAGRSHQAVAGDARSTTTAGQPAAAELSAAKLLWRMFKSWLRQVFSGKREAR
jgi:carbon monoxide dehydrogenase subunit G